MKPVKKKPTAAAPTNRHKIRRSDPVIDADQAKLIGAQYCLFHYPTLFTAGIPRASKCNGDGAWTVPIVLTDPNQGVIGEIGEMIVETRTGEVISSTDRAQLIARAKRLQGT